MFDQRLFNQISGLDSGFGEEDDYNLYDKPLFADRTAASIYKGVKEVQVDEEENV
jgi:SNW domain-containing protein 1